MNLFRITKTTYVNDISGEGAKLYGARWNRPGQAVLYTSEHRSLALLELIVHFNSKNAFKLPHSYIVLEIEEQLIETLDNSLLPKNQLEPNDNRLWKITDYYFKEKKVLALRVPSVLIPEENNIILNVEHIDYKHIKLIKIEPINLDERFKNIT